MQDLDIAEDTRLEMELWHRLSLDDEFDALNIEPINPSIETLKELGKYPGKSYTKLHAHKVARELGTKSGLIYLEGEVSKLYKDSDQGPALRQRRYFYYLTGVNYADCHVTYDLQSDKLTLWMPVIAPRDVLWYGKIPTLKEAADRYDVDEVRDVKGLSLYLLDCFYLTPNHSASSSWADTPSIYVIEDGKRPSGTSLPRDIYRHPTVNSTSLKPAMDQARVVKTKYEIAMIRKANDVSSQAHRAVGVALLQLQNEREIEAIHQSVSIASGAKSQAYAIIAASGTNASTLHYDANDKSLEGKQVVVVDAGCEWDCYASDITRSFPLKGRWDGRAKTVHRLVQEMQEACISRVKPGQVFYELHLLASEIALKGLIKIGVLKGDEKAIREAGTVAAFFPHGLGHHVGLEVHDVSGFEKLMLQSGGPERAHSRPGRKRISVDSEDLVKLAQVQKWVPGAAFQGPPPYFGRQALQPGMVVTIEPGIYFCREYLEGYHLQDPKHSKFIDRDVLERYYDVGGVRIEDCILVVEDGYENLTSAPKGDELVRIINGEQGPPLYDYEDTGL